MEFKVNKPNFDNYKNAYTKTPDSLFLNKYLSNNEKIVIGFILMQKDQYRLTTNHIASGLKMKWITIDKIVKSLIKKDYLSKSFDKLSINITKLDNEINITIQNETIKKETSPILTSPKLDNATSPKLDNDCAKKDYNSSPKMENNYINPELKKEKQQGEILEKNSFVDFFYFEKQIQDFKFSKLFTFNLEFIKNNYLNFIKNYPHSKLTIQKFEIIVFMILIDSINVDKEKHNTIYKVNDYINYYLVNNPITFDINLVQTIVNKMNTDNKFKDICQKHSIELN
jgi:hypothetical protein